MTLVYVTVIFFNTARVIDITEFCRDCRYGFIGFFNCNHITRGAIKIPGVVDAVKVPEFIELVRDLKNKNRGGIKTEDYDLLIAAYKREVKR